MRHKITHPLDRFSNQSSVTPQRLYLCMTPPPNDTLSFGKESARSFLTAPFSGLAPSSVRSNRALKIGPEGVLSCVTFGSQPPRVQAFWAKLRFARPLHHGSVDELPPFRNARDPVQKLTCRRRGNVLSVGPTPPHLLLTKCGNHLRANNVQRFTFFGAVGRFDGLPNDPRAPPPVRVHHRFTS